MLSRLINFAVLFSLAHVGVCYFYTYFFSIGFGSYISSFFSIENIFSIGIADIIPVYIIIGISFILVYFWMERDPFVITKGKQVSIHSSLEGVKIGRFFSGLMVLSLLVGIIFLIFKNKFLAYNFIFAGIFIFGKAFATICRKSGISRNWSLFGIIVLFFIVKITWESYSEGFTYRHRPYSYFDGSYLTCNDKAIVLMKIGDNMLVVRRDSNRFIYNIECKPIYRVPRRNILVDIS